MRDLVVAGGGPVGLATALYAIRAGLDVVVREPRTGAVDKACGEGLMPGAVHRLAGLGVHPDGRRLAGIRYLDGDRRAEAPFRGSAGLGVRRTTLHAALMEQVLSAGIPVEPETVRTVEQCEDHVLVDGEPARYLVAADGLHSGIRRRLGLDRPPAGHRRYGQRVHVALAPWTDFVEVHWARCGEAYVTPVGPDQVGVAVLTCERRPHAELLEQFPGLAARLRGHPASRPRGAGPLRQRALRRTAGRVLLVGDAGGYVDALTGEGIALGLAQAEAAVAAVRSGRVAAYDGQVRRMVRRHETLTHGLVAATRVPLVRRHLVGAAAALPWVFGTAVDQLARPR